VELVLADAQSTSLVISPKRKTPNPDPALTACPSLGLFWGAQKGPPVEVIEGRGVLSGDEGVPESFFGFKELRDHAGTGNFGRLLHLLASRGQ